MASKKRFEIVCIFFLFLSFISSASFPKWFLFPGDYPQYIIGFSYGQSAPVVDAERMACLYEGFIVNGSMYHYLIADSLEISEGKVSDYFYNFSFECLERTKGSLHIMDTFMLDIIAGSKVAIFSKDKSSLIDSDLIELSSIRRPEWIDRHHWEDDSHLYQVGAYSNWAGINDAWKTSEERAMFKLLTTIRHTLANISSYRAGQADGDSINEELEKVTETRLEGIAVRNIETLERYPDLKEGVFYTLIRLNNNNYKFIN